MTSPPPVVGPAPPFPVEPPTAEPPSATEGGGVVSSWADLGGALAADQVDADQVAFAATAAGLDTLGVLLHPFDELLAAGFGWLIEHVWFLSEPLDVLAGDPGAVLAQARGWQRVAAELQAVAAEQQAATVPGWAGPAADAYRWASGELVGSLRDSAGQAAALSELVLLTGGMVGTVRALIRDLIADFLTVVAKYLLAAAATSFFSGGGSLATVTIGVILRALDLAEDIARRIGRLLDSLVEAGGTAGRIAEAMQRSAARLRAAEPELRAGGEAVYQAAGKAWAPEIIEAGKQLTGAEQAARGRPEAGG